MEISAVPHGSIVVGVDGSDASAQIVSVADGTVFAVRSGGTTSRALRLAAQQLPRERILGVALLDEAR